MLDPIVTVKVGALLLMLQEESLSLSMLTMDVHRCVGGESY